MPSRIRAGSGWSPSTPPNTSGRRGGSPRREALAEQALAMGDKLQDVPLQSYAGQYFALACNALGEYRRASELLRVVTQARAARRLEGRAGHGRLVGRASGDQPRLVRALSCGAGGVRRGRRRRPPGGGPGRRPREPLQPRRRLHRAGLRLPRQGRPRRRGPRARAGLQRRPRGEPHAAAPAGHPASGRRLSPGRADRGGRRPGASGRGRGRSRGGS